METSMAQKTLTMRQIHEILRLKYQNQLSIREIARSCGLPVSTVGDYIKRVESAGLTWPLPEGMTEEGLTKQLFGSEGLEAPPPCQPLPDWLYIHNELRRKSVTLQLLWEEYRQIIQENEPQFTDFEYVERFAFYERARQAYAVLASSEKALYANIILKKGVVKA